MDHVRKFIVSEIGRRKTNLAEVSRALGKNHAYLQQFITRGIPATLPEEPRRKLARLWAISEGRLGAPRADARDFSDDEPESDQTQQVPVKGYVAAGATAHFLPLDDDDFDRVDAPQGSTANTVALEIRGTSLGELFDRWLVFVDDIRTPVTPDLIGKTCVVGLADGRILVKKLKRAGDGLYDLLSNTEEPIRGAAVQWAAKVKIMAPR